MILPDDVKCKTCEKVFCCSKCRINHQEKFHSTDDNYLNKENIISKETIFQCAICYGEPFILYPKISDELLIHISKSHLPLHCKKCCKLYTCIEDIVIFSKCNNEKQHECNLLEKQSNDFRTENSSTSIGIQTSPYFNSNQECYNNAENNVLTPMSMINLKWKAKAKCRTNSIIDSASSLKNVSSIHLNSCDQRIPNETEKIKTVRTTTTSTPMPITLMKNNQKVFDASSSCQVSSIHSTSTESEDSPVGQNMKTPPSPLALSGKINEKNTNVQKLKSQTKIRVPATPLRQVMSKSIQKAMMEHAMVKGTYPKKKIFDSMEHNTSISTDSPLDLRTSPALRRTYSEVIERNSAFNEFNSSRVSTKKEVHFTATKKLTEYLISSTSSKLSGLEQSNTIYKTCQSIEVVTTTTGIENLLEKSNENSVQKIIDDEIKYSYLTPKISGLSVPPLKKTISFETPNLNSSSNYDSNSDISDEVFYTPTKSLSHHQSSITMNDQNIFDDKNSKEDKQQQKQHKNTDNSNDNGNRTGGGRGGGLWSLLTSVIRFKSSSTSNTNNNDVVHRRNENQGNQGPSSLIRRCASFAGVLSKPKISINDDNEMQAQKRKRTSTYDTQFKPSSILQSNSFSSSFESETPAKRIRRIQGRKPIERMRNLS